VDDEKNPQQSRKADGDPKLREDEIRRPDSIRVRKGRDRFLERDSVFLKVGGYVKLAVRAGYPRHN